MQALLCRQLGKQWDQPEGVAEILLGDHMYAQRPSLSFKLVPTLPSKVPCNWQNGKAENALFLLWLQYLERLLYK